MTTNSVEQLCINTLRFLAIDAVERANSGHPGMPMGAAPMAYVLWTRYLRHNPANPRWPDRDRFVLSAGHGSMLLYGLLHLSGYDLPLDELKNFRQWGSKTPGHPEHGCAPGVETTTGPLGQGFANGVGMAIAERALAARFNRPDHEIIDHYTYGMVSDGDLMEGISHEAASLAGHLKLGKLIYFYDDNHISIEGHTDLAFSEDRMARFRAYGWQVLEVADGNDLVAIGEAIEAARSDSDHPSLISVRTRIGYGSPNREDTPAAHGEPLGEAETRLTKEKLGWPLEPAFHIPTVTRQCFGKAVDEGRAQETEWRNRLAAYGREFPELAEELARRLEGDLPEEWHKALPEFAADAKGKATRAASGEVLNAIAPLLPELMGGSADLAPSTKTLVKNGGSFQGGSYDGRNLHFGVREHGMGGVINGMALHGGFIPYGATFLIFSDYMRPTIRLAAIMGLKVVYVFTHDSIGLGEDGPTHQPIEHLASLRAMPGLTVIRPADANETARAWRAALTEKGPAALILSRQNLPTLDRGRYKSVKGAERGAYIVSEPSQPPRLLLMASGSELHIALEAADVLADKGIMARVVSMMSWEIFERQSLEYRHKILPPAITVRLAVEAGATLGWERYTGSHGRIIGLDRFGASAPYRQLYSQLGITVSRIVTVALEMLTG